jgi:hypothetical protein
MKRLKLILLGLVLFFLSVNPCFASTESIQNFYTEITVHKDGKLDIVENIKYDFSTNQKHGIFRNIPLTSSTGEVYRKILIQITSVLRNGEIERYVSTEDNNILNLKIGKAEKTISGLQDYVVSYSVVNAIGNFDDHDEIYWNTTGTDWSVAMAYATATVRADFDTSITKATCFTGISGATEKKCEFTQKNGTEVFQTTAILGANEGLTIVAGFPPNTFPKSKIEVLNTEKKLSPTASLITMLAAFILPALYYLVLPYFILRWYLKNRHKSRFGKPTVNFDIPKDNRGKRLLPAEAGVMDTSKLDRDDVTATIFDLAIRKYIFIEQTEKKKNILGLGGGKDFVVKKKKDYKDLTEFEKTLLDRLFKDGDTVSLNSLSSDFYTTFSRLQSDVFSILVKEGFYKENPQGKRAIYIGLSFFAIAFFLNLPLAFIFFWMFKTYNGRTDLGDEADFRIDGLKLFLDSMSREHKWYANQLALVEQMIPYSIALGYIDKFMEQLKISYPDYDPSWYRGNLAFYAISGTMLNSINSGITTNAPSRSSGFSSGGGFSGGGGGGGGGGSW